MESALKMGFFDHCLKVGRFKTLGSTVGRISPVGFVKVLLVSESELQVKSDTLEIMPQKCFKLQVGKNYCRLFNLCSDFKIVDIHHLQYFLITM